MYYLLLELPALRQLLLTRTEWARGIEKSLDSLTLRYGVELLHRAESYRLYRYPPVRQSDLQELLAFLLEAQEILDGVRDDLLGYTLLLHRSEESEVRSVFKELKGRILPVALEDAVYCTPEAAQQIAPICELYPEEESDLLRLNGARDAAHSSVAPLGEIVASYDENRELREKLLQCA